MPGTPLSPAAPPEACSLARAVGEGAGNVVEFAALVEFEINEGALVRARYPPLEEANTEESQYLCEQLLPDRSEGYAVQRTLFFMNRPRASGKPAAEKKEKKQKEEVRVPVAVYRPGASADAWTPYTTDDCPLFATFTPSKHAAAGAPHGELFIASATETTLSIPLGPECRVDVLPDPFAEAGEVEEEPTSPGAQRRRCMQSPVPVLDDDTESASPPALPEASTQRKLMVLKNTGCGYDLGVRLARSHVPVVERWVAGGEGAEGSGDEEDYARPPLIYCMAKIKRRRDSAVKRGAIMKGMAIGVANPSFAMCFEGVVDAVLERCLNYKDDADLGKQSALVQAMYEALNDRAALGLVRGANGAPLPWEATSAVRCAVWKNVLHDRAKVTHKASLPVQSPGEFDQTFSVDIPYNVTEVEVCEEYGSGMLLHLLDLFKDSLMTILNAIVARKRVVFLSYKRSADELCRMVMGVVSLMCPPFSGLLPCVFPYTSLTCMHLWLGFEGGVVGVTNPMFEARTEWWDVLCNIDSGKVTVNEKLDATAISDPCHALLDHQFITKLAAAAKQQPQHATDGFVRHHVREYFGIVVQLALGDAIPGLTDGEVQTFVEANQHRVRRLMTAGMLEGVTPPPPPHIASARQCLSRLRGKKPLSEDEALLLYQGLVKSVLAEDDVLRFLLLMPQEADGLFPLALGLYHPSKAVRLACVAFMRRIDATREGKLLISALNTFLLLAYERCSSKMPVT